MAFFLLNSSKSFCQFPNDIYKQSSHTTKYTLHIVTNVFKDINQRIANSKFVYMCITSDPYDM